MVFTPINLLMAMLVVLGLNQLLIRLSLYARVPIFFWVIQAMNLTVVALVVVWGVPGLSGNAKLANWIIALVVSLHFVQNIQARMSALAADRREELEREWEELEQRREEVRRLEAEEQAARRKSPPPSEG